METTKFTVIFNDANRTVLFTNDTTTSRMFAKLSKLYTYRIIENKPIVEVG